MLSATMPTKCLNLNCILLVIIWISKGYGKGNSCHPLNKYIECYQVIHQIDAEYHNSLLFLNFKAFNKEFNLILHQDPNLINRKIKVRVFNNQAKPSQRYIATHYYTGSLQGDFNSKAHGQFKGNVFFGKIQTSAETYYIENYKKYFNASKEPKMVIYRSRDIVYWKYVHEKQKGKETPPDHIRPTLTRGSYDFGKSFQKEDITTYFNKSSSKYRKKRQDESEAHGGTLKCQIEVTIDNLFYEWVGLADVATSVGEVMNYINQANDIFMKTDFNGDGTPDNIGISLKSIDVHETPEDDAKYLSDSEDVTEVLMAFSKYDLTAACLGMLFTYKDFEGGVIGLAWVASTSFMYYPGGICQQKIRYQGEDMCFNSLVISALNYGLRIPSEVTALTTAHELGHSFGSEHDEDENPRCAPGGFYGQYIMHTYSNEGKQENNFKFSPCSIDAISPILDMKASMCFKGLELQECGNQIVEEGEECDCGSASQCPYIDRCCTVFDEENPDAGCHIDKSKGYECSPLLHSCCDANTCKVKPKGVQCATPSQCGSSSFCDGVRRDCPPGPTLPDGTLCNKGTDVCINGTCSLSICEYHNLKKCDCVSDGALEYDTSACEVCCQCKKADAVEQSSFGCIPAWALHITHLDGSRIYSIAGTPCLNDHGFCNNEHECLDSSEESIMNNLKSVFKDSKEEEIADFSLNYFALFFFSIVVIIVAVKFSYGKIVAKRAEEQAEAAARLAWYKTDDVCQAAQKHFNQLEMQLNQLQQNYIAEVQYLGNPPEDRKKAHLVRLFPTAGKNDLQDAVKSSLTEEAAVDWLLKKGLALAKLNVSDYSMDNDEVKIALQMFN